MFRSTSTDLRPAAPLDLLSLYPLERAELLDVLGGLTAEEWGAPTECPAWSVKGIALHILGDDLSLLSRQRDDEAAGVQLSAGMNWDEIMGSIDRFNEKWVEASSFFSAAVLVELLRLSGEWTHAFYSSIDPHRLGEPVPWAGPDPAPYWLLSAREYGERWIHQMQIRRAVHRSGRTDARFVVPAVAVAMRGFPQGFSILPADDGTTFVLSIDGTEGEWTIRRDGGTWSLYEGAADNPTVQLAVDLSTAAALFSRAMASEEVAALPITGDADLAALIGAGLAAFFGRSR